MLDNQSVTRAFVMNHAVIQRKFANILRYRGSVEFNGEDLH